jgi:hypothetical protein
MRAALDLLGRSTGRRIVVLTVPVAVTDWKLMPGRSVRVTRTARVTKLQSANTAVFGRRDPLRQHADDSVQECKRLFEEVELGLLVAADDEQLRCSFEG